MMKSYLSTFFIISKVPKELMIPKKSIPYLNFLKLPFLSVTYGTIWSDTFFLLDLEALHIFMWLLSPKTIIYIETAKTFYNISQLKHISWQILSYQIMHLKQSTQFLQIFDHVIAGLPQTYRSPQTLFFLSTNILKPFSIF